MKKFTVVLLVVAAVMVLTAGMALAGVSATRHNLGSGGSFSFTHTTDEVCVFCHTPHNANTAAGGVLWNRTTDNTGFTMYGTTQAGNAPGATPSTITVLCLSCHDGINALNVLYNYPGAATSLAASLDGSTLATSFARIDKDLRNDHPVGLIYGAGTVTGLQPLAAGTGIVAKVTGAAPGNVTGLAGTATVECSSCHDPHDNANGSFLRATNGASALCLVCHIK